MLDEFSRRIDKERPLDEGFEPNPINMVPEPVEEIIEDLGMEEVSRGSESVLFGVNDDVLLKVSPYKTNVKGEYVIFLDPDFSQVTPAVYDHGEEWWWYAVERVDPIGFANWEKMMEFFPTLKEREGELSPRQMMSGLLEKNREEVYQDLWSDLTRKERDWFEQILALHSRLGRDPHEVIPKNLGVDSEGNLVFLDILSA